MNMLKKDQSRTEIALIIGFIVLALLVIGRLFGAEIMGFFFGAGDKMEAVGTAKESQLTGDGTLSETPTDENLDGTISIESIDPSMYGNEEAVADFYRQKQQEKQTRLKSAMLWTFSLIAFIAILAVILWKIFVLIRDIKHKNAPPPREIP